MSVPASIVYVVDDDPSVRKAVSRLLRSAGLNAAAFASPQEFLDRHDPHAPGCLVLDLAMPGMSGLELQQELAAKGNAIPIIFLTGRADVPKTIKAMKHGAVDFLTKPLSGKALLPSVRAAIEKDSVNRQAQAEIAEIRARLANLTPREREVLSHIISGRLNKQIAADLGTVEMTIKVHRARVLQKMNVRSLAELVRLSERAGITPALADLTPTQDQVKLS